MLLKTKTILLIGSLLLLTSSSQAETAAMSQTKTKLKQLETKISHLQSTLNSAHNKTELLHRELSNTEKKISIGVQQLHNTTQELASKQHKIALLQEQVDALNEQLHAQQQALAKQIRARYMMGEYQPLKWLLNQDNLENTSRLLTFYQYVVQSRQHAIDKVQITKKNLTISQDKLHQEIKQQQQLQQQLNKHQHKLQQDKLYRTAIISSLNKDIQTKQQSLEEYQRNKNNLSNLLITLTRQSVAQTHPLMYMRRMMYMRKKLPRPVEVSGNSLQNMNQGVIFFAKEGASVAAVYPGKVVFSDWLKGYGLLLIIDHGRGFMTLYAHNQSLFKQKGDTVNQGEQIATVGHSGGLKQNGLYFEIRQRGKAIPPLRWLS